MTKENENNRNTKSEQENILILERFFKEVWNDKRVDRIYEFLSPDVVSHFEHDSLKGIDIWVEAFYQVMIKAIPDFHIEIVDIIAKGEIVVTRWNVRGTHMGELMDVPPSGETIEFSGMSWIKMVDGKMSDTWNTWDMSYFIRKLQSKESSIALKVLIKQREKDKEELEKNILFNVNKLVIPYLDKLKTIASDNKQKEYLEVIESNMNNIISPFAPGMEASLSKLSPAEIMIADYIRNGKTTKEIAGILNLSPTTIAAHRQNIRKKLALTNKGKNLQTALQAIS